MSIKQRPQPQPKPPIACAWGECTNMVERGQEYSFVVSFMTRGPDARLGGFQCPDFDEVMADPDTQHFCCSVECAAKCAHACIDEHLVPQHNDHVSQLAALDAQNEAEREAMTKLQKKGTTDETADPVSATSEDPHAVIPQESQNL